MDTEEIGRVDTEEIGRVDTEEMAAEQGPGAMGTFVATETVTAPAAVTTKHNVNKL